MKQHEVLILVECVPYPDEIPNPMVIARVRKAIGKMDGVIETYLAPNTSNVGALADWDEVKMPLMVTEIKKIEDVKNIETRILVPIS